MRVIFRSNRSVWSRRHYGVLLAALWGYTLSWVAALVIVNLVLPVGGVTKAVVTLILVIITPTDVHFMSYQEYRRWHAEHVVVTPRGNTQEE